MNKVWNVRRFMLLLAFACFVLFVIGIFADWTGKPYASLPWDGFVLWTLSAVY